RRQGRVRVPAPGAGASLDARRENQTPHRRQFLSAPPVDVIIVNWNNREETVACLDALMPQLPSVDGAIVTVVDNGSTDGSIAAITTRFPTVRFVPLPENRGFTGGIAAGLVRSAARNALSL